MILGHHDSVDVIIPARGLTPWLQLALSSIASQSLQPTAITVVDDGLENASSVERLGEQLFGTRFRLLRNQGTGISAALNTGVQQSTVQWIARMDVDDISHPSRLKQQILFLNRSPENVLGCGTQVRFVNSTGQELETSALPTSWEDISRHILSRTCFVHPTLVLRRDALLQNPYRSVLDGAEDLDLVLRLSERGTLLNVNQMLLDYRIHFRQESVRARARQTAIQELAFRLALQRRQGKSDPVDSDPSLAEEFIRWRLSTTGYIRSRTFLTAVRYMKTYWSGRDFRGLTQYFRLCLGSLPLTPAAISIAWRVYQKAGAALIDSITPFDALNIN
jgi:glycosyltransferase involved in cell wall biosynthesis